jgi:hypothetical protein
MKRIAPSSLGAGLIAACLAGLPATATACTACMGDPSSKTAGAINAAIFLMLGFIALMLASLAAFAWYLSRKGATAGAPLSGIETDAPEILS